VEISDFDMGESILFVRTFCSGRAVHDFPLIGVDVRRRNSDLTKLTVFSDPGQTDSTAVPVRRGVEARPRARTRVCPRIYGAAALQAFSCSLSFIWLVFGTHTKPTVSGGDFW